MSPLSCFFLVLMSNWHYFWFYDTHSKCTPLVTWGCFTLWATIVIQNAYRVESFSSDYGRDVAQILKTATCNNIFSRNMSYVNLVLFKTIFNYENHCRFKAKRALKALKRNSYSAAEDQIVTIPFSVHSLESSLWVSSLVFPQLIVHVFFPVDRK